MLLLDLLRVIGLACGFGAGCALAAVRTAPAQRGALAARWLRDFLVALGPAYVKLGQLLATRSDLLPDAWIDALRELQDRAPHMSERATRRALARQLGRPLQSAFAAFELQPLASASIAQVHKAVLGDGRVVAVKLVKQHVRRRIARNLATLRWAATLAHALAPPLRRLCLPARLRELSVLLLAQTDMRQEAARQQEIAASFAGHPYVRVPAVIPELLAPGLLVMEYMSGIPGRDVARVPFPRAQLARRVQDTIYTMLYMHGLCHGDPHPGNLLFGERGELILLDFGITVELSEDEKWGLSSFYYACTRRDWDIAIERFTRHFVTDQQGIAARRAEYCAALGAVLREYFDARSSRWSTIGYFRDVNRVLRRFGARYTASFTKVELVFVSCEGFASQIDPQIDLWANARLFTDRYSPYMSAGVRAEFDRHFGKQMPSSLALRDSADDCLVAPTHIHRYFFPSAYPIFVQSASGGRVTDVDGNEYVDLSGGYGPHILGYAHPAIAEALQQGIAAGIVNALGNEAELRLARALVEALPGAHKAILCNSGTESVLLAIRLCRALRRRSRVAKFEGQYHGFSDQGMVSSWFRFAGPKLAPEPVAGTLGCDPGTVKSTLVLQYGDLAGLERLAEHAEELACVICEPLPSSVVSLDREFLAALRERCSALDIPLVFDEVVSGFRVAYGGAQSLAGVQPDLTCLGKIIGGGLPCGAVVGSRRLIDLARSSQDPFYDYEYKAFAGGTMSGNSLSCAAGAAALAELRRRPQIYRELEAKTASLAARLRAAAEQRGVSCRIHARHSIFSLSFSHRAARFYRERMSGSNFKATIALAYYMRKHGVYLPELHSFLLSAAHSERDLDAVAGAFERSLDEMLADGLFVA